MNDDSNAAWHKKINFNTFAAIIFIVLWTVVFFIIPYQIQKPMLFMGRSLMGLKPTLFPRLATLALIALSIWFLIISFRIDEKNGFKEVAKEGYFRIIVSLVVFVAYALLFDPLGFVVSSMLVHLLWQPQHSGRYSGELRRTAGHLLCFYTAAKSFIAGMPLFLEANSRLAVHLRE
jgi:hypothetical protein